MRTLTASLAPSAPLDTVREGGKSGAAGPLLLKVLAISILLPDEMGFLVQGLWFSIARIILLALTPVLVIRFGQLVAAGRYRFVFSDLLVPLTGFWMLLALGKMDGMQDAMNHAGPLALEYCVGYMAARFLLSEHGQAVSFINFLCWAIAFVALLGLADTLTEAHPVVPGSSICGMRMPSARAREGIQWPRAIGVSTLPLRQKAEETATGMRISSSRHVKTWKPAPVSDFARHPYMLMNLGQRDEPPLTHRFFVHYVMRTLIGSSMLGDAGERLGLLRATSTLEHPILFGFTCGVGLILAASMPIRERSFAIFACGLGAFLALSSAPMQGAVFGLGLLLYNRMVAGMDAVDPLARQIAKSGKVLWLGQPYRLEAAHLAGRPFDRPVADHPTHGRIAAQPLGIVHVLVAGKPAEYRLPEQADEQVTTVLAGAHIREHVTGRAGEAKRVVQLAIGEQSGIGGDHAAVEFQLQAAVKIEPQRGARRLTRWVHHARLGRSRTRCCIL